jgi:hypothetical protein
MLFKKNIAVYTENRVKLMKTKCKYTIVKASGIYSYHWALNGNILVVNLYRPIGKDTDNVPGLCVYVI